MILFFLWVRLEKLGALEWQKVVHGHQFWRLITSAWLHGGLLHLVATSLSLLFIGIRLEQQFGFSEPSPMKFKAEFFLKTHPFGSSRGGNISAIRIRRKPAVVSFPEEQQCLCGRIGGSFRAPGIHACRASHELDYLLQ